MLGFKPVTDDKFYNRRRLALVSLIYAVAWGAVILVADIAYSFDAAKVAAYLGFVTTVCGLPTWQYLRAAAKDDETSVKSDSS